MLVSSLCFFSIIYLSLSLRIISSGYLYFSGTILKDNEFTLHHIIPRAENGKNDIDNLIGLCNKCHDIAEDEQLNREEIINHEGKCFLSKNKIKYIKKSYFMPEIDNQ